MNHENTFLGTGWGFPPAFDHQHKGVGMVRDNEDIVESLQILLSTTPGERPMEPHYGCNLGLLAFQRLDTNLETLLINNIKQAILYYESRIQVNSIKLAMKEEQEGIINIKIEYTIKATNTRQNMVYPYYLEEGTNL